MKSYSTPAELAESWKCSVEHVRDLIRDRRLDAFSLSKPGSKRPRLRISEEAIAAYESQHRVQVPIKPARRQRERAESVIEFYK